MRVVITGGAGFIGANLARRLLEEGHSVGVIDDLSTGRRGALQSVPVSFTKSSILDDAALAQVFDGADAVVHLAAIPSVPRSIAAPLLSHEANATGTLKVLQAAHRVGAHVTVASSSSVYGATKELPKREDMVCQPRSPYAVSKLATEAYALAWQSSYEVPTIAFRFFNVYGPLQAADHAYAAVIPAFLSRALANAPVVIHGDGLQTRDFTFVDSVTTILARAARERTTWPRPVNLAFGSHRSLLDVLAELECLLGRPVAREHVKDRPGDVRDSQADDSCLRSLFPDAEPTDFSAGLKCTLDWMRKSSAGG